MYHVPCWLAAARALSFFRLLPKPVGNYEWRSRDGTLAHACATALERELQGRKDIVVIMKFARKTEAHISLAPSRPHPQSPFLNLPTYPLPAALRVADNEESKRNPPWESLCGDMAGLGWIGPDENRGPRKMAARIGSEDGQFQETPSGPRTPLPAGLSSSRQARRPQLELRWACNMLQS